MASREEDFPPTEAKQSSYKPGEDLQGGVNAGESQEIRVAIG